VVGEHGVDRRVLVEVRDAASQHLRLEDVIGIEEQQELRIVLLGGSSPAGSRRATVRWLSKEGEAAIATHCAGDQLRRPICAGVVHNDMMPTLECLQANAGDGGDDIRSSVE
jgi:hypothetical protein